MVFCRHIFVFIYDFFSYIYFFIKKQFISDDSMMYLKCKIPDRQNNIWFWGIKEENINTIINFIKYLQGGTKIKKNIRYIITLKKYKNYVSAKHLIGVENIMFQYLHPINSFLINQFIKFFNPLMVFFVNTNIVPLHFIKKKNMRKIKIIDCDLKLFSIPHIFDRLDKNFFSVYVTNNKQYDDFSKILPKINVFPIPELFYVPKIDLQTKYNPLFLKSKKTILFDNIHINEIMQIIELSNLLKQDKESDNPCFIITKQYDYDPKKFFYAYNYFEVDSFNFNKIPKNADFIIVNNREDIIYSHFDTVFVGGTLMPGNIYNTDYNIPAMIYYNCIPIIGKYYQGAEEFVEFLDYKDIIIKKSDIYQLHLFYNEYLKSKNIVLDNKTNCMKINKFKESSILSIANEINTDAK